MTSKQPQPDSSKAETDDPMPELPHPPNIPAPEPPSPPEPTSPASGTTREPHFSAPGTLAHDFSWD